MDPCRYSSTASPLQHRHRVLLVYIQPGNCRLYRFFQRRYRMGIQLRHLFPGHVCRFSGKRGGEGYPQIIPDRFHLLCPGYGGHRILHLLRRLPSAQSRSFDRNLSMLRFYHGCGPGYRLLIPGKNPDAVV